MSTKTGALDDLLQERRRFPVPAAFLEGTPHVSDASVYAEAESDLEAYWAGWAEELDWYENWDQVLDWRPPRAKWFVGGKLNVCHNCVDRHLKGSRRNKAALIWEGEPGDVRVLTYHGLHQLVAKFAKVLKQLGLEKGDRGRDLPAHDSRGGDRDARLRAHRRGPFGGVRRLQP